MAGGTHDEHTAEHPHKEAPVAASIVGLLIAIFFGWVFALLNSGAWETGVIISVAILGAHTLFNIWVRDRD